MEHARALFTIFEMGTAPRKLILLSLLLLSGVSPAAGQSCSNTCNYASDGDCDDGGPGSEFTQCNLGADCRDCGPRSGGGGGNYPPPPSPSPPPPGNYPTSPPFAFRADTGQHRLGLTIFLALAALIVGFCTIYCCCFATAEGQSRARLATRAPRALAHQVAPAEAKEQPTKDAYEALHPYFKEGGKGGRKLANGDFHHVPDPGSGKSLKDLSLATKTGLKQNRLVKGKHHQPEALRLLTRGVSALQILDNKGIFTKGADDLQNDPMHYFNQSRPTNSKSGYKPEKPRKFKAFLSHSWDAKDFNPRTVEKDRAIHANNTTKAILWHIKYAHAAFISHISPRPTPRSRFAPPSPRHRWRMQWVSIVACQVIILLSMSVHPMAGPVGLLLMLGLPLYAVNTKNPMILYALGFGGDQFWMDKAT